MTKDEAYQEYEKRSIINTAEEVTIEGDCIYSNIDHILRREIEKVLLEDPNEVWSQHAARDFCGYIWYDGKKWREEICQWKSVVEILEADTIEALIEEANSKYGSG